MIICSPGDGILPGDLESGEDNKEYCDAFLECVHEFNENGGGVFWFLDNYPYTYEADLYFKKYYQFEAIHPDYVNKEKWVTAIPGGKYMKPSKSKESVAGTFVSVGGNPHSLTQAAKLNFNIKELYEGKTLCKLNEEAFLSVGKDVHSPDRDDPFEVFAREHDGNAAIIVRNNNVKPGRGRMIIDTATSKLFDEFTRTGIARYISNGVVWLCNIGQYVLDQEKQEGPSGIRIIPRIAEKRPFEKREYITKKLDLAITIIFDTTNSMGNALDEVKAKIKEIYTKVQKMKRAQRLEGDLVFQVIQYKDFAHYEEYSKQTAKFTSNIEDIQRTLDSFKACGGSANYPNDSPRFQCAFDCEDMQTGFECAIKKIKEEEGGKYMNYYQFFFVIAADANHGDCPDRIGNAPCRPECYGKLHPIKNKSFEDVWKDIFEDMKKFDETKGFDVCLFHYRLTGRPNRAAPLEYTYRRMVEYLGDHVQMEENVTEGILVAKIKDAVETIIAKLPGIV